jgi:hypothetical protein
MRLRGHTKTFESLEPRQLLAGVTLLTHGFQLSGDFPGWVNTLASAMIARMDEASHTRWLVNDVGTFTPPRDLTPAVDPMLIGSGERMITLDWADASNNSGIFDPLLPVQSIASRLVSPMTQATDLPPLAELPIHLMGHSRGGVVVGALARMLGEQGIWIDHVTLLDPAMSSYHGDQTPETIRSNTLFADRLDASGTIGFWPITGTRLPTQSSVWSTSLGALDVGHTTVHTYYRGTVDSVSGTNSWFTPPSAPGTRSEMGYAFSRIAGGDRTLPGPRIGLLPALGGSAADRPGVAMSGPQWPNVAHVRIDGSNTITAGDSATVRFLYGDRDSASTATIYLDLDDNPYNTTGGYELGSVSLPQAEMQEGTAKIATAGLDPGTYRLFVKITDGERTRYSYMGQDLIIASEPHDDFRLYFPEGYRSGTVNEYIPLVNPNPEPVSYEIFARYEFGERDQLIAQGILPASSRGGITTTEAIYPQLALVRENVPYAIEIRSTAPIGAMLSHYDFGIATGEAFTPTKSSRWWFPEVEKDPGRVLDFIIWYNPSETDAVITLTVFHEEHGTSERTITTGSLRRGGISITDSDWMMPGSFSVRLESTAAIVASLSHYELAQSHGHMSLGQAVSVSIASIIPLGFLESGQEASVVLRNTSLAEANVGYGFLTNTGYNTDLWRPLTVAPGASVRFGRSQLDELSAGQPGTLMFIGSSTLVAGYSVSDQQRRDAFGFTGAAMAYFDWLFADGFMANATAGSLHLEYLNILSFDDEATSVMLTLYFPNGETRQRSIPISGISSTTVALHEEPMLLEWAAQNGGNAWFSIGVSSQTAIVASMVHWDLAQPGGWATLGTPILDR